jgi:hypothetical protein
MHPSNGGKSSVEASDANVMLIPHATLSGSVQLLFDWNTP